MGILSREVQTHYYKLCIFFLLIVLITVLDQYILLPICQYVSLFYPPKVSGPGLAEPDQGREPGERLQEIGRPRKQGRLEQERGSVSSHRGSHRLIHCLKNWALECLVNVLYGTFLI